MDDGSGPVDSVPDRAFVPLQPPDAVQDVASVAFHVRLAVPPDVTLAGVALKLTEGAGLLAVPELPPPPPPHAAKATALSSATMETRRFIDPGTAA